MSTYTQDPMAPEPGTFCSQWGYPAPPGLTSSSGSAAPERPSQDRSSHSLSTAGVCVKAPQAEGRRLSVLELTGEEDGECDWEQGGSTGSPGFGGARCGLEGQAVRTCPREAQPRNHPRSALRRGPVGPGELQARVPSFQARSCTCMETQPVAGGREKWGRRRGWGPHLCVRVGREEGGEVQSLEVEKLVVPCPPSRGWRWQAGVETDFSSGSCL